MSDTATLVERLRYTSNCGVDLAAEAADRIAELEDQLETTNTLLELESQRFQDATKQRDQLQAAINRISPWLAASLTDYKHDGKRDYGNAVDAVLELANNL